MKMGDGSVTGAAGNKTASGADIGHTIGAKMTLRSALSYGSIPQEMVDSIDEQLRSIKNPNHINSNK